MISYIKVFGERNTGTNYFQKIIELNLDIKVLRGVVPKTILVITRNLLPKFLDEKIRDLYFHLTIRNNLGWKHSYIEKNLLKKNKVIPGKVCFITITKNPYSWLLSLYDRPYHQKMVQNRDFIGFLQSPWQTVGRENYFKNELQSPIDLWNMKNASYIDGLSGYSVLHLRYEDILENPAKIIGDIHKKFMIPLKQERFINFLESTKNDRMDHSDYREYYLLEKWKNHLTPNAIKVINKRISFELMTYFNYELIDPNRI